MQLVHVHLLWTLLIFCWLVHVRCEQPPGYVEIKGDCRSASEWTSLLTCNCGLGNCRLYCLHDEENRRYLICLDERRVDKGYCPYLNGPHKYYDQRPCEEKDGTCPEEEYSLGNNMYNFSACFPSSTSLEATGDDKGIDCDCSAVVMTPSIIVVCTFIISVAIGIVIGNESAFIKRKYQQMKKCCCGICSKKTPEETHTAEGLEQTQMLGSSGTSSDLQVDIRVEDGEGRALAVTQPADQNGSGVRVASSTLPEQEQRKTYISQHSTTF